MGAAARPPASRSTVVLISLPSPVITRHSAPERGDGAPGRVLVSVFVSVPRGGLDTSSLEAGRAQFKHLFEEVLDAPASRQ
ncbi:hypothetical protein MANAM107_20390 [Actinomyces capricornis]|uniref:Uncharacterized protein n=1 Tax=Actinomyces capricornis TaxID=2755559 RepID=A0ABM7UDH3_9ACTO|nr:hypothetical protein MANAM107_20390 [Actinomyces capricornis]